MKNIAFTLATSFLLICCSPSSGNGNAGDNVQNEKTEGGDSEVSREASDANNEDPDLQALAYEALQNELESPQYIGDNRKFIELDISEIPQLIIKDISKSLDTDLAGDDYPKIFKIISNDSEIYVADYKSVNGYCGSGGCSLSIYSGAQGNFEPIFEETVFYYRIQNNDDNSVDFKIFYRTFCSKKSNQMSICLMNIKFDGDQLVETK